MKKPVVKFQDVSFSYQETPILRNVNFEVGKDESIGIIGPNGGGKTTLLKLIMGFIKPDSGTIEVFGKEPGTDAPKVAYVPQSLRYDKQFPISVMELVMTGRLSRLPWYGFYDKADREAAEKALEMVKLENLGDRAFGTLSGGQMQRALIARALAGNPDLLLLDEPTASVDSKAEADIYELIKQLHSKITVMMVTHDLRAAIEYVKRVICVQGTVISLDKKDVCEHFAMGLYHPPLIQMGRS